MKKEDIINNIIEAKKILIDIKINEYNHLLKFETFEGFLTVFKNINFDNYVKFTGFLQTVNLSKLLKKINQLKRFLDVKKDAININWNSYNDNYKNYLNGKFSYFIQVLKNNREKNFLYSEINLVSNRFLEFYNSLMNLDINDDILENFSQTNSNIIIFGKNGSGKTRLLHHVQNDLFNSNSFVLPSNRNVEFGKLNNIKQDYKKNFDFKKIFYVQDYDGFPNDYLNVYLKDLNYDEIQSNKIVHNKKQKINIGITLQKIIDIFNSLNLNRKIFLDSNDYCLKLYNDKEKINEYYIKDGSDGEKSIIQFIIFIILCPENSFVFIDEPENHLNSALLVDLFNILEQNRKDLIFIYFTHNLDFIETRENSKLFYLENYDGKNWNLKLKNKFEDIPIRILIDIIGTKKEILFIEGTTNTLEYDFYSNIFSNYKVIPVECCNKVIENCKVINNSDFIIRKAIGIIDNDYKDEHEVNILKNHSIFSLNCNEFENLLLSSDILEYACKINSDKVKQKIICMVKKCKNDIISDYINKIYYRIIKTSKVKYDEESNISKIIDNINIKNKQKIIDKIFLFSNKIDIYIKDNDYDSIINNISNKGFLSCTKYAGFSSKKEYIIFIIDNIKSNIEFKNMIIENHFSNILK